MDTYCEYLFRKKKTLKEHLITILAVFAALILLRFSLLLFAVSAIVFLIPAIWFGIIWGTFQIIKRQNIEYEYLLTGADLDVDKVIAKSSRKRIISVRRREIEAIARPGSDKLPGNVANLPVTDVTSGYNPEAVYVMVIGGTNAKAIHFEPTEKMLEQLRLKLPGKLFTE